MLRKQHPLRTGVLTALLLCAGQSWAGDMAMYKVTVTNLTPGQPLAPIMATTHKPGLSFFKLGAAPSDELAMLAEAGNGRPMAEKLLTTPGFHDAQVSTQGLTFPGKSTTMMVSAKDDDRISVGAMLGATNDAFFAISDMKLPMSKKIISYTASAYDAGSETNDELMSTVAGLGGEGYSPYYSGEGFVHVHSGIHGIGDADPAKLDWRNPVAIIEIQRMK